MALKGPVFMEEQHYLPRLMLPCIGYGRPYYSQFHSIFEDKNILHKNLPELYKKRCLGSSHGWLIMAEEASPSIFAINPLENSTRIHLPSLLTFPDVLGFNGDEYIQWAPFVGSTSVGSRLFMNTHLKKVVLSKDPTVEGCAAVAIFGDQNEIAVCRVGDKEWKVARGYMDDISTGFRDVVFDRKGEFYAVNDRGTVVAGDPGRLYLSLVYKPPVPDYAGEKYLAFDATGRELMLINRYIGDDDHEVEINCSDYNWYEEEGEEITSCSDYDNWYGKEVESGSEEYYDCDSDKEKWKTSGSEYDGDEEEGSETRISSSDDDDDEEEIEEIRYASSYFKTSRFRIFRLDEEWGRLEEIYSLKGEALFLGDNESLCLTSREFPGCKANCVYFTDDRFEARNEPRIGAHDIGVFSLKDGSIDRFSCIENEDEKIWPPPIWVALAMTVI